MVSRASKNITPYEGYGEELSVEVAYLQAAAALDIATAIAVESRDTERLENLTVLWMELGTRLLNGPGEASDNECEGNTPQPVGFVNHKEEEHIERVAGQPSEA